MLGDDPILRDSGRDFAATTVDLAKAEDGGDVKEAVNLAKNLERRDSRFPSPTSGGHETGAAKECRWGSVSRGLRRAMARGKSFRWYNATRMTSSVWAIWTGNSSAERTAGGIMTRASSRKPP